MSKIKCVYCKQDPLVSLVQLSPDFITKVKNYHKFFPPLSKTTLLNNHFYLELPLLRQVSFELFKVKTKSPILLLSLIFAFKFPMHRHFGFCDAIWLPLLLGSRASCAKQPYDVMKSKMAARGISVLKANIGDRLACVASVSVE